METKGFLRSRKGKLITSLHVPGDSLLCDIVMAIVFRREDPLEFLCSTESKYTSCLSLKKVTRIHKDKREKTGYKVMMLICINQILKSLII
jgi:hypothetical protein